MPVLTELIKSFGKRNIFFLLFMLVLLVLLLFLVVVTTIMMLRMCAMPLFFENIAVFAVRQELKIILEYISFHKAVDMLVIIIVASMLKHRQQE